MITENSRPVRRGRTARKTSRETEVIPRLSTIRYGLKPIEMVSADELERIHQASLWILKEIGIDFRDETALRQWREAGADVRANVCIWMAIWSKACCARLRSGSR